MLRIRNKDGSTQELPEGCFIEMVNDFDGKLGSVWWQDGCRVVRIKPGTTDADRYEKLFGLQAVKFLNTELTI